MAVHSETGATSLPTPILYRSGRLEFNYLCKKLPGQPDPWNIDGTFRLTLYGTSDALAANAFSATTWYEMAEALYATRSTTDRFGATRAIEDVLTFDTSKAVGTETIAINAGKPTDSYTTITVDPLFLYYSTTSVEIFDSASGVGQFSWLATDGGQKG